MSKLSKKGLNRNYIKSSKLMRGGISECENYKSEYDKYNKIYIEEKKKIRDLNSNIDEIETLMDENTNEKLSENEDYTSIVNPADKIKKRLQLYEETIIQVLEIIKKSMRYFKQQGGGSLFTNELLKALNILEGGKNKRELRESADPKSALYSDIKKLVDNNFVSIESNTEVADLVKPIKTELVKNGAQESSLTNMSIKGILLHIQYERFPNSEDSDESESSDDDFEEQIQQIGIPFDDKVYSTIDKFINSKYQITCFEPYDNLIQMIDNTINNSIITILKIFNAIKKSLPDFEKNIINKINSRLNIIKAQLNTCESECGENEMTPEQKKTKCDTIKCIPNYLLDKTNKLKNCADFEDTNQEEKCHEIYDVCNYKARTKPTKPSCTEDEPSEETKDTKKGSMAHVGKAVIELNKLRKELGKEPINDALKDIDKLDKKEIQRLVDQGYFDSETVLKLMKEGKIEAVEA
jgi:hypothetical protein